MCGDQLTADGTKVDTAMRFAVFFDSFQILHTRAHNKDTVWYGFAGMADAEVRPQWNHCIRVAPASPIPARCYGPTKVGDRADGTYALNNIKIGDFQWVPGRTNQLKLAVMTVNAGAPKGIGPNKDMAGFAFAEMINQLAALDPSKAKDITGILNSLSGWRGCDGPTAGFALTLTNTDVAGLTRDSGSHAIPPQNIFVVPSQTGCGASSKYRVNLTVRRSSWQH